MILLNQIMKSNVTGQLVNKETLLEEKELGLRKKAGNVLDR